MEVYWLCLISVEVTPRKFFEALYRLHAVFIKGFILREMEMEISTNFKNELAALLNKHGMDNKTHTPDYLLAHFLCREIQDVYELNQARDKWFNTGKGFDEKDRAISLPSILGWKKKELTLDDILKISSDALKSVKDLKEKLIEHGIYNNVSEKQARSFYECEMALIELAEKVASSEQFEKDP